jgi:metallo-beta-lactamase class B
VRAIIAVVAVTLASAGIAQQDPVSRSWNQPVPPFRIAGNLYYVGAIEICSYLIATPKGLIVIDGGFVETAPMIRANIAKLGFRIDDVRILLNTHAHFDHAGGLAQLKKWSGATLIASKGDAPLLARGGADDPQFSNRFLFPPVEPDRVIDDGARVELGGTTLIAHLTPGHTAGCTTWTATIGGEHVVIIGSATVPKEYKLTPAIIAQYRHTFTVLKSLPCDIPLGSHGSFFDLADKLAHKKSFVDPAGYRDFVRRQERAFEEAAARANAS